MLPAARVDCQCTQHRRSLLASIALNSVARSRLPVHPTLAHSAGLRGTLPESIANTPTTGAVCWTPLHSTPSLHCILLDSIVLNTSGLHNHTSHCITHCWTPLYWTLADSFILDTSGLHNHTSALMHSIATWNTLTYGIVSHCTIYTMTIASTLPSFFSILSIADSLPSPSPSPPPSIFSHQEEPQYTRRCLGCLQQLLWWQWTIRDDDFGRWYTYVCCIIVPQLALANMMYLV